MFEKIKVRLSPSNRVPVPTILQMEATECGAASLSMVLAHYGLWIPLEKMRMECGVNRDGSSAWGIMEAAQNRHCTAKGYRWKAKKLLTKTKEDFPLIIHWEFNHFVVLEGIDNGVAYLNDPAMGRRKVPWEEFRTSYTGISILVRPGPDFKPEGRPYSVVRAVAKKLSEDPKALLFALLIGLAMIFPGLAAPVFNQIFIDDILTGKRPDWMFKLCLAMAGTLALNGAMSFLRATLLTRWQQKLTLVDSSAFFWHLIRLPLNFFQQRFSGEIASRIAFNESVAGVLSGSAATVLLDFFVAIFYLLLLLQYSVTLTILGVGLSLMNMAVFLLLRRKLTDMTMRIQQDQGKEYGTVVNGLMMIETIKANGNETDFFAKWAGYHAKVLLAKQEAQLWSLAASVLPALLDGLNAAVIMTVGGFSIMEGVMTAGVFMAFRQLMASFQEPVSNLIHMGQELQTTETMMLRLDDVRRYKIDALNYPSVDKHYSFSGSRLSGKLEFKDITFGYSPLEPPLLENFNMTLEPGRWVAIVGFSGSGKSTLAKILTGLYEEWSGEVLFDGVNRWDIPRPVIVASLASVDQDIFQITGTVRENISFFDNAVPFGDVMQAAKDACIHEDILQLDGGYEAKVAEGGLNFSGGQRQRLEIARALAKNPSILVLDEATSALDPVTEQIVLENIHRRGCACFIVAHRLSTIRDADEIIVLDQGKVAERGTHEEMISHDGPYRRLLSDSIQAWASVSTD